MPGRPGSAAEETLEGGGGGGSQGEEGRLAKAGWRDELGGGKMCRCTWMQVVAGHLPWRWWCTLDAVLQQISFCRSKALFS